MPVLSIPQASRIMAACRKVYVCLGGYSEDGAPIMALCIRMYERALSDFQKGLYYPPRPEPKDDLVGLARREQG